MPIEKSELLHTPVLVLLMQDRVPDHCPVQTNGTHELAPCPEVALRTIREPRLPELITTDALFPFSRPITEDTLNFGGISTHKWTWSGLQLPSTILRPLISAHRRIVSPPQILFCRATPFSDTSGSKRRDTHTTKPHVLGVCTLPSWMFSLSGDLVRPREGVHPPINGKAIIDIAAGGGGLDGATGGGGGSRMEKGLF